MEFSAAAADKISAANVSSSPAAEISCSRLTAYRSAFGFLIFKKRSTKVRCQG
jgi:hypothetical protein